VNLSISVLAFARLRELFGFSARELEVPSGSNLETLWDRLVADRPDAAPLRASTRFARNGILVDGLTSLADGDEIALMPPVGGG